MICTCGVQSCRPVAVRSVMIAIALVAVNAMAAASPVVSEDVPIPGGLEALARAIGIDAPDRARCVAELARLVYADSKERRRHRNSAFWRLVAYFGAAGRTRSPLDISVAADDVPIPLTAAVWSRAVFHRPVAREDLFAAVMSDRAAALLAHGLAALDAETLLFLMQHPALVTRLYEREATVFAAFAAHLHIRNNRVVPPGGDRAVPLWEALLNENVANPEGFVRELFARGKGRIAYLYDVIGYLDRPRAAFALGFWIDDASLRVERFKALALAASSSFREWDVRRLPFSRPAHDLLSMLSRMQVDATGSPASPAWRGMWARVFAGGNSWSEPIQEPGPLNRGELVDAAWLAEILMRGHARSRIDRLDQFAFGQRVFATVDAATLPDALVAIRTLPLFRMLPLTLERIGIRRPALYAALARQAERVSALDGARARTALAEFQGAIALIARLARVKSIDRETADTLLGTLAALPFDRERGYRGAFAPWLELHLRPALAGTSANGLEDVLVEALAGAPAQIPARRVSWEGQHYMLDFVRGEADRLRRFRARQDAASLDAALDLYRSAEKLAKPLPRSSRALERLFKPVDAAIGEALLSLSYAIDWSDPPGAARLTRNVAGRHDFGLAKTSHQARVGAAWALPGPVFESGAPWRVQGAILGLDVALAPLALRRINTDRLPAPHMSLTERDTFVTSFGLMNPLTLQDAAQDAIAAAIARGQRRVDALRVPSAAAALGAPLARAGSEVTAVVGEIAMDGWRARALRWTMTHDPQRIGSLFTMTDLLYLGGGGDLDLNPWGMSAISTVGCLCTHLPPPGLQAALVGRPHVGLLAATVADLNLRVAVTLHELELPAALAKTVLAAAVQDFVDRVKPSDFDDWLTLVRTARGVSRERIEDYVAAATTSGPFVPTTHTQPVP